MSPIESFLSSRRIAMIGVSRNPKELSRSLFTEFRTRGYDVVPVNTAGGEIDGAACFTTISSVEPRPDAALLMLSKSAMADAVRACADAGISRVWAYGVSGAKDVPDDARRIAEERGLEFVAGYCPYMFLPKAAGIHRFHGWVWKVLGKLPSR